MKTNKIFTINTAEALLLVSTFFLFLYIYDNYTYFGFFEDLYRLVFPVVLLYFMPLTTLYLFLQSYIRRLKAHRQN
ncbi:hypothetical protein A4244_10800 [Bacillus badius]|uniref:Uncharacterized protein n=1 Tax=Bacillus badius TaxID=1455 RepID=A0ABR5ATH4_BACBA|nr:hypothetical protein SD77_1449 [Bacillus badius]KZN98237.1 hypothetical protein A4244_10800 [Bacillus badius]KZR58523.1 hypothetical protein A3781_16655 [Bacillus badius]OCS82562.1 hypothetical protein A6M11_10815 [Bacillus badius]OVE50778.1 hypothetical protein B1A98_15205 [Bacillus badius]